MVQILNCESSGKQEQDYDYNMNKKRSLCDLTGLLALTGCFTHSHCCCSIQEIVGPLQKETKRDEKNRTLWTIITFDYVNIFWWLKQIWKAQSALSSMAPFTRSESNKPKSPYPPLLFSAAIVARWGLRVRLLFIRQ